MAKKKNKKKIAIIIPCYNEESTICKVISDARKYLPQAAIYVCDNASTDQSLAFAKESGANILSEPKRGKGNAFIKLLSEVEADCYVLVDADDTYPLNKLKAMTNLVLNGNADVVIGDRLSATYFTENKRPLHGYGNRLVTNLVNKKFGTDYADVMSGMRIFNMRARNDFLEMKSRGFEMETEMAIIGAKHKYTTLSYPVEYRDRRPGSKSKLNTIIDGAKILNLIHGAKLA